jgi:hypothetical protein
LLHANAVAASTTTALEVIAVTVETAVTTGAMIATMIVVMIAIKTGVMTATMIAGRTAMTFMVMAVAVRLQEGGVAVVVVDAARHLGLMPSAKFATKRAISPVTAGLAMMMMIMVIRRFMLLIAWTQIGTRILVPHITSPGSLIT